MVGSLEREGIWPRLSTVQCTNSKSEWPTTLEKNKEKEENNPCREKQEVVLKERQLPVSLIWHGEPAARLPDVTQQCLLLQSVPLCHLLTEGKEECQKDGRDKKGYCPHTPANMHKWNQDLKPNACSGFFYLWIFKPLLGFLPNSGHFIILLLFIRTFHQNILSDVPV